MIQNNLGVGEVVEEASRKGISSGRKKCLFYVSEYLASVKT